MMTGVIKLVPGDPTDTEECVFVSALLADPSDVTSRKVFADWLDEHGRAVQAKYLRDIRKYKFVKLVTQCGWWALYPRWADVMPSRVTDNYRHVSHPPPEPSPRCESWKIKTGRGWVTPKWMQGAGYAIRVVYFGVYVWEQFNVIDRLLDGPKTYPPVWPDGGPSADS